MANGIDISGENIVVKVKFTFDKTGLQADINKLVDDVKQKIGEAFGKQFFIDMPGARLNQSGTLKALNDSIVGIKAKIAESLGKLGDSAITIKSLNGVSVDQSALDSVGQKVSKQMAQAIEKQFKNIKLNLNGKNVNASQLISAFNKQLAEIQKQAQAQTTKATTQIDPATLFTTKGKLRKNASLEKFSQYIKQETKEIEDAYATLQQVLSQGSNLQPGMPGFAAMEAQATDLVNKIVAAQKKLSSIKAKNPQLFDRSQTSGALESEQALLRITSAATNAQAALSQFSGGVQQIKASSQEAKNALKILEEGFQAAQKAQQNYNNAQQKGIGSAAKKQYQTLANQQKALATAQLDKYNTLSSSGALGNLNASDTKLVTASLKSLNDQLKQTDAASNKNAAALDSLRNKYLKLVDNIDTAIQSSKKFDGAIGQTLTNRLTALRSGVSNMISQDRFDVDELAGFSRVFSGRKSDLGTIKTDATNLLNQLQSVASQVKQVYTDIAKAQTQITKTTPGTQAFADLELHLNTLQSQASGFVQQMQTLQAQVTKFYGSSLPTRTQKAVDSAYAKQAQVLSTSGASTANLQVAKQDMQDLAAATKACADAQQKLQAAQNLGTTHQDYATKYKEAARELQNVEKLIAQIQGRHPNGIDLSMPGASELKQKLAAITREWTQLNNQMANSDPIIAQLTSQYRSLIEMMRDFRAGMSQQQSSASGGDLDKIIQNATGQLRSGQVSSQGLADIRAQFDAIKTSAQSAGKESLTFGQNLSSAMSKFAGYFSITMVIMQAIQQLKQMIDYTRQLDTAMTELRKVTDVSEATYSRFLDNAAQKSVELGATLTDVVTSTGDFARLGYSIDEALQLSEAAVTLKNVGDGIESISDASEKIISAMKGFDIPVAEVGSIIDKYNEVGNNFAISSSGIAEAMERSSAALASAGNSIDQSVALATGGNLVVQNPEKVGNALKTLSLRLTKTKAEIEDLGEDSDGAAISVSELRNTLLALSNQKVDILDGDSYKSTYDILKEMSVVWGEMSQMNRQGALFAMGGMNHANVLASIIQNFDEVEAAYQTSLNSAGSAAKENEKYLNSVEGRIQQFQSAMQKLSSNTFSADFLKGFIGAGTQVVEILDKMAQSGTLLPGIIGGIAAALSSLKNVGMLQFTDWSRGFGTGGTTTYTKYGANFGKSNTYGSSASGWINNIAWLGTNRTINDFRTNRQYRDILNKAQNLSGSTLFGSKGLTFNEADAQLVKEFNKNLGQASQSSKTFGEAFNSAWAQAEQTTQHTNDQIKAIAVGLNDISANGSKAAKDVAAVKLSANNLQQVSSGTVLGNFAKSLGIGALNMGVSSLLMAGIQGIFSGIDYAIHYSENKISEGQAVIDKYVDAVKTAKDEIANIRSVEAEFNTLAAGVNDFGQNISLSVEDYQRYQEIVSQIISISPSLIAGYDAEGNALANKNTLLQEAINLQQQQIELAARERKENATTEFKKYQEEYKAAKNNTLDTQKLLAPRLQSIKEQFAALGVDLLPDSLIQATLSKTTLLTQEEINSLVGYMNKATSMAVNKNSPLFGLVSPDDIRNVQELVQEFAALGGQLESANQGADDLALFFVSQTEAFKSASEQEQEYINRLVANRAKLSEFSDVDDLRQMSESIGSLFESDFDISLLTDIDDLIAKFQQGDVAADEFKGQIDKLVGEIANAFAGAGIAGAGGQAITPEEIRTALGIESAYDELERLETRLASLNEKFRGKVDFSNIVNIDDTRSVTELFEKLDQVFKDAEIPSAILDGLNVTLKGNNIQEVLDIYTQLTNLSLKGSWGSDDLIHVFDTFSNMDIHSMREYIGGLESLNGIIEALGLEAERDKEKISNLLSAFVDGNYSIQFNQLNDMFDRGIINSKGFDEQITGLLDSLSKLSGVDFGDIAYAFLKSLDIETISSALSSVKETLDDFYNADYSVRPFMMDSLSAQVDALNELKEKAKAAHDVQSYFDLGMLSDQLSRTLEISIDPIDRLNQAIELSTAALNEQSSAGRVSYDTFRNLQAIGPEYAATLRATNGQLMVNKEALQGVIEAERQQSSAQLASLQKGAITRYAELGAEIKKVKEAAANGTLEPGIDAKSTIEELQRSQQEALHLADSYNVALNSLEELIGARAKLDALLSSSTVAEDFENSWGKINDRLNELKGKGQWADIGELLSTVFNSVPDDVPGMTKLMDKVKSFGSDAASILKNVAIDLGTIMSEQGFGGLSHIDVDTGEVVLMEEELQRLSDISGYTVDFLRQTFNTMSSFDPQFHETGITDYMARLDQLEGVVNRTSHGISVNAEEMWKQLSGEGWSNSDISNLINKLDDAGYLLLDAKGNAYDLVNELNKLSHMDGMDADVFKTDFSKTNTDINELKANASEAVSEFEWLRDAISEIPSAAGTGPILDVTQFVQNAQKAGKSAADMEELLKGLDGLDYSFTLEGNTVGVDEAIDEVKALGVTYGTVKDAIEDAGIDLKMTVDAADFLADMGVGKEACEALLQQARELNDTEFEAVIKMRLEQMDEQSIEGIILRTKGDVEELQSALDNMIAVRMADGAWGIPDAADQVGQSQSQIDTIQKALDQLSQTRITIDTSASQTALKNLGSTANSARTAIKSLIDTINTLNSMSLKSFSSTVTVNQRTNVSGSKLSYGNDNHSSRYASGVRNAKSGMALVNDGTPVNGSSAELIIKKNTNDAYIANQGRMAMVNLERGDTVLTAKETQDVFNGGGNLRFKRYGVGNAFGAVHQSTNTSTITTTTTNKTTTSTNKSSSSSTSQIKQQATEQAKADTDARKEQFEKFYKEVQYMRDKDVIKEDEYYERLSGLVAQYLEGREDLLDEYRQYDVEVYKGLKQVWEDNVKKEFATLEYQLGRNLITEKEYYRQLTDLNEKYYAGKEEYLEEWRKNDLSYYNWEQSLIAKEFKALQYQRDMDLIDDRELYNAKQKLAEKYYKDQEHYIDEWRDHQVAAYKEIKELQKESYEKASSSTPDLWYELGLVNKSESLKLKENAIYEAFNKGLFTKEEFDNKILELNREKIEAARDVVGQAQQAMSNAIEDRMHELEQQRSAETRPIELEIRTSEDAKYELQKELDAYEWEVSVRLRPLEDEKWSLERKRDDIERQYDKLLKPLQRQQKDKQREQDALQREYELALRPIQKELDALSRQKTQVEHEYEQLLKPYTDQQTALQREQSAIQHEQELALRPIDDELSTIQRLTTQINHNYEMMLRPLQDQQKVLQQAQTLLQHEQELTLRPIEKQLNALNREITHINKYYERMLKPYEEFQKLQQKQQALLEREQELALRPIEKELDAISRQTTHINRSYELRLRPLNEQLKKLQEERDLQEDAYDIESKRYALTKAQTERINRVYKEGLGFVYEVDQSAVREAKEALRQDWYDSQIEALQKKIDKIEDERDKIIEILDDQSYDLTEKRADIQENYNEQLLEITDNLYKVGLIIERLTDVKEALLDPLEDRIYNLTELRTDITEKFTESLEQISDNLFDIGQKIQRLEDERDKLLRPLEDRVYALNEARLDLAQTYEAQLRRISDALYEVELSMQSIEDKRKEIIDSLEDRIYDLTEQRLNMEEFYEAQLQEIADVLFDLTYQIEQLEYERDRLLEPIDDRLWEINRQIEDINRESELHTRILQDQIHEYEVMIDEQNRELELINRKYDDQVWALEQIKDRWDNIRNPIEQSNLEMQAIALWGEKWHEMLGMINSNDLPSIISQAQNLSNIMASIAENKLGSLTPDYQNPGINNIAGQFGSANEILGTTDNPNFTQSQIENMASRIANVLNNPYVHTSAIDITTLSRYMGLYERYKNGDRAAAEELQALNRDLELTLALVEAAIKAAEQAQNGGAATNVPPASSPPASTPVFQPSDYLIPDQSSSNDQYDVPGSSPNNPAIVEVDSQQIDEVIARFERALAAGASKQITSATISNLRAYGGAAKNGNQSALTEFWEIVRAYEPFMNGYASGRSDGGRELAITQERGAELLAAKSGGRYTLLSPGDKVFSNAQTENLWRLSLVSSDLVGGLHKLGKPEIQTHRTDLSTYTVSVGDVIVQHADSPEDLSRAIINRLPNQLLQDMKRRS